MKTTPRDKVLMMILPALIILLFYGIFVARGRHTMLTKLTADVAKAHEKQPSQAQLQAQQRAAAETQRELYKLQTDMKTWDDRWHALAAPCLTHDRRSYRQSKLLTLLKEQNIHVKDHGPLDGSKDNRSNMKLSTVQDRLVKLMEERGGQQKPHLWCLQVEGGYRDITRALRVLSSTTGELVAIPLSLVGHESKTKGNIQSWSILVWI